MRWLTSRFIRADRDRGASVILIAIITPAILLGMGAFVVDIGGYYSERAQTQNGADAAAVAIANTCAKGTCDTTAGDTYAPANSNGNLDTSSIVSHAEGFPCGRDKDGILPACPAGVENGTICPPAPSTNYVDVQVNTDQGVPAFFSSAFGNGRKNIGSCAQAIWGPPKIGDILALTIAECAWNTDTNGGQNYAPSPPDLPSASYEVALVVHNPDDPTDPTCVSGPSVGPLPGGFGWTLPNDDPNTPCTTSFIAGSDGWYTSDPGQGTSTGSQCLDGGQNAGVIPCAQNPVVSPVPFPPNSTSACPDPPTPSPLIVPIYDNVCVQTGSTGVTQDEMQSVTVTNATNGTYTLSFTGAIGSAQATANIAWDATAATVQTALAAVSNIGTGNVLVTGDATTGFTVEFTGTLADTNFALMNATSNLAPASGPNRARVTVAPIQDGNFAATACPAGFANGKYYHLLTKAAFVITGYEGAAFPHDQASWLTGRDWCVNPGNGQDETCLLGYFVQATDLDGEIDPNAPDTGVTVVKLNG
jgi:hypothetical protein